MSAPPDRQPNPNEAAAASPVARNGAEPRAGAHALTHLPSYLRFLSVAVLGLALDLWSKHWAFHTLGQRHESRVIIPHVLEFQTMLNSGALFGIGGGQTLLFLLASVCALLLVFWMFAQSSPRRWALQLALGGILAGALGNMYDRVLVRLLEKPWPLGGRAVYMVRVGHNAQGVSIQAYPPTEASRTFTVPPGEMPREIGFVRDFIKIPTRWFGGREVWPWVFNFADVLLVGGVAVLALHLWRDRKHGRRRERNAVDSRASPA